jgi:hypothetical protein
MNLHRLFPVLLLFAFAVPSHGQVQQQARVGSLLQAVSDALDHYQLINMFDIYQVLQQIMAGIGNLGYAAESYGEHNRVLFAETYNNFVKIYPWFGNEMRDAMQETEKRCDRRDPRQTSLEPIS